MSKEELMADPKTGVARWNETEGSSARSNKPGAETARRKAALGFLCAASIALVVCFMPLSTTIKRGLFLKGGNTVTLEAVTPEGEAANPSDVSASLSTIGSRLNKIGVVESSVTSDGTTITMSLPEDVDAKNVAEAIGSRGVIEFIDADEIGDADALELIQSGKAGVKMKRGTYSTIMDSEHLTAVDVSEVTGSYFYLSVQFDDEGAELMADATERIAEDSGSIAVAIDGCVITIANVSERLSGDGVNVPVSGGELFARAAKACYETGLLPIATDVGEVSATGALLGDNIGIILLAAGLVAIVAATVYAYMRYKKLALIVGGIGLVYAVWVLGLMGIASRVNMYTLTVPGVLAACVCGVVSLVAALMLVGYFSDHVAQGGSIKGASMAALREGLQVLIWPTLVFSLASAIFLFVPWKVLGAFGQTGIFGVIAALAAIVGFGSTALRVLAAGAIREDREGWGLVTGDAKGDNNA